MKHIVFHWTGLELSGSRHDQALWILDHLRKRGYALDSIELKMKDITQGDFEGGTHFLLCSTAFSASGQCPLIDIIPWQFL